MQDRSPHRNDTGGTPGDPPPPVGGPAAPLRRFGGGSPQPGGLGDGGGGSTPGDAAFERAYRTILKALSKEALQLLLNKTLYKAL